MPPACPLCLSLSPPRPLAHQSPMLGQAFFIYVLISGKSGEMGIVPAPRPNSSDSYRLRPASGILNSKWAGPSLLSQRWLACTHAHTCACAHNPTVWWDPRCWERGKTAQVLGHPAKRFSGRRPVKEGGMGRGDLDQLVWKTQHFITWDLKPCSPPFPT